MFKCNLTMTPVETGPYILLDIFITLEAKPALFTSCMCYGTTNVALYYLKNHKIRTVNTLL